MYYTVLFIDTNLVGTVKRDWLIDENQCKYPPLKKVNKFLKPDIECDTTGWNVYKIILKNPKNIHEIGIKTLKKAREMENFYVKFSDTDDYQRTSIHQKHLKLHPTLKIQEENNNFNNLVPKEVQPSVVTQHNSPIDDYSQVNELDITQNSQSLEIEESTNEYGLDVDVENSEQEYYNVEYLEEFADDKNESLNQNVDTCQVYNTPHLIALCEEILRNVSAVNDKLASMDKRLATLELNILHKLDLNGFSIEKIKSQAEFDNLVKQIENDGQYRQKLTYFLYVNCPSGKSKHYYNGVTKKIAKILFDEDFLVMLGWSSEKNAASTSNEGHRTQLCQYKSFLSVCLDVLNYNDPKPLYTIKDVGNGFKEFFKRLDRS